MKTTLLIFFSAALIFLGTHSVLKTFAGVKQETTKSFSTQKVEKVIDYDTPISQFVAADAAQTAIEMPANQTNYENPPAAISEFIVYLLSAATGLVAILLRALIKRIWPNFEFDQGKKSS